MFTKLFLTAIISTLALSAFSADTQAGRYRTEGPSGGGSGGQAGRYSVKFDGAASGAAQTGWNGQTLVAGRYRGSQGTFAPAPASIAASEYAGVRTQRAAAADVSYKPSCCK